MLLGFSVLAYSLTALHLCPQKPTIQPTCWRILTASPCGSTRWYASAFIREKPHVNVGTIGHVDHGKTTLTAAMTKGI